MPFLLHHGHNLWSFFTIKLTKLSNLGNSTEFNEIWTIVISLGAVIFLLATVATPHIDAFLFPRPRSWKFWVKCDLRTTAGDHNWSQIHHFLQAENITKLTCVCPRM
jgi:hypothetical protein